MQEGARTSVRPGRDPTVAFSAAIFVLLALGTIVVWAVISNLTEHAREQAFQQDAVRIEHLIHESGHNALHYLSALEALFQTQPNASYADYARAFDILDASIGSANIIASAYLELVDDQGKQKYEERIRKDTSVVAQGFPNFAITPAGQRNQYMPVTYYEPFNEQNATAHGFDVLTEPNRQAAVEKARDTGEVTVTPQIEIARSDKPRGFVFYAPLYDNTMPRSTVVERRLAFRGAVTLVFETAEFFNQAINELLISPNVDVEVYDGTLERDHLLYDRDPAIDLLAGGAAEARDIPLQIADRTWIVRMTYQQPNIALGGWTSTVALGIGLILSAMVSLSVHDLLRARRRTILAAQSMIDRLRVSEQSYEEIIESSLDPIITVDVDGRIRDINTAAEHAVGYARSELVGQHFGRAGLIPTNALPAAFEHFAASASGERSSPYSLPIRHKDGSQHTYEIVSRPLLHGTTVAGVQIVARGDTERIQLLKRIEDLGVQLKEANDFIVKQERKHIALLEQRRQLKDRPPESR